MPKSNSPACDETVREKIEVTQEDDCRIWKLVVDGKVVSTAKTLLFGSLFTIGTIPEEQHKGYATKLLHHIEEAAKKEGVTTMKTLQPHIESTDWKAVSFFRKMGYTLTPVQGEDEMLEASKQLIRTPPPPPA